MSGGGGDDGGTESDGGDVFCRGPAWVLRSRLVDAARVWGEEGLESEAALARGAGLARPRVDVVGVVEVEEGKISGLVDEGDIPG